jgi:predicted enzyme related to lactoylglutathione lyase
VRARGIAWTGVQTDRFDETERFLRALLGGHPNIQEPGFRLWTLANGDLFELFAPEHQKGFGTGPVVGIQVDDIDGAVASVVAAGGVVVGGYGPNDAGYRSVHVRGPDGNIYEVVHDPDHEQRAASVTPDREFGGSHDAP